LSLKSIKSLIIIALGTAIMAFGIINFAVVNDLANGGITGITIIIYHLFGMSTGTSSLLLNIPMFIVSYFLFDKPTFFLTIFGTVSLSVFLWIFEKIGPIIPNLQDDMLIVVLGFGVTIGSGLGMILRENGTTGGAATLAKILKDLWNIPVDKTLFYFDTVVVLSSFFIFLSFSNGVYTLLGLFIATKIVAKFQEGFHSSYKVMIISNHSEEIATLIQEKINRGITFLYGRGGFTKNDKEIILTIVSKRQLVSLKKVIYEIDPKSFVSVSHVYETLGEGFTFESEHKIKKLVNH